LSHVAGHAGLATDVGVNGVGGGVALLLREDGLLFEKRREEFVRVLNGAESQHSAALILFRTETSLLRSESPRE
jgi:hypothetical protein